jgi:hypothetical protein
LQRNDPGLQPHERIHADSVQRGSLLRAYLDEWRQIALERGIDGWHVVPYTVAVATREHAGDDTARGYTARIPAEITARAHPREIRDGVTADLAGATHRQQGGVGSRPRPRWVENQERAASFAVACGREEARAPQIAPRRRRNTDEVDLLAAVEGKQASALAIGADDVVIGELVAVRSCRARPKIRNGLAWMGRARGCWPIARQWSHEPHQLRIVQRVDDEALVGRVHRQPFEQLLIVDEL